MKKLFTIIITAIFFVIVVSLIDQFVWHNDFYWLSAVIGFITGATLVILGNHNYKTKVVI